MKEEGLLIEQYRVKKEISRESKPRTERRKFVTHSEDHHFLVKSFIDISDNVNFFGTLPPNQLTRV
jgi:hypothetical protein